MNLPHIAHSLLVSVVTAVRTYLIISCYQCPTVRRYRHCPYSHVLIWHQLVGTDVLAEIPYFDTTRLIARYQFALIWMDDSIIDGSIVVVFPLHL
jgi:hypothetical protein